MFPCQQEHLENVLKKPRSLYILLIRFSAHTHTPPGPPHWPWLSRIPICIFIARRKPRLGAIPPPPKIGYYFGLFWTPIIHILFPTDLTLCHFPHTHAYTHKNPRCAVLMFTPIAVEERGLPRMKVGCSSAQKNLAPNFSGPPRKQKLASWISCEANLGRSEGRKLGSVRYGNGRKDEPAGRAGPNLDRVTNGQRS